MSSAAPAHSGAASAAPHPAPTAPTAPKSGPGGPGGPGGPPPGPPFGFRLAMGLFGILLAAICAGLSNRVASLTQADVQGALGFAQDDASWLNTIYSAGELVVMPFASWMAITFSMRRFHLLMASAMLLLAALMPFIHSLPLLLVLRGVQGICAGALIPILMMAALRFLPPPIRLHGLALYAMTATFAPNVALWIATFCVDQMADWRWVYWQIIPIGLVAMALVAWGIPKMPLALPRLKQGNWLGMALGVPGLGALAIGMDQGVRLDWFNSHLVVAALGFGSVLTTLFLISEWRHPAPFMRLQMLQRRNLGLGFTVFFCLLITMGTGVALPTNVLAHLHGFRLSEITQIGLVVGLPQLVLGSVVALLLYQRWVDARYLFVLGLALIGTACWMGAQITAEWMTAEWLPIEVLQALGQPLAVVSLLFLGTSVVQPMEGPFVAGIINTLRALGTIFGGAVSGQLIASRSAFHQEVLLDQVPRQLAQLPQDAGAAWFGAIMEQANVLAAADVYRIFGTLALLLIAPVLCLQFIPAPQMPPAVKPQPPQTPPSEPPQQPPPMAAAAAH